MKLLWTSFVACWLSFGARVAAKKRKVKIHKDTEPYTIALWGDLPYRGTTARVFDDNDDANDPYPYGTIYTQLRDSINAYPHAFTIHAGDILWGGTGTLWQCNDTSYTRFQDLMNSLHCPGILTLGDNEWTDCHRDHVGGYDPLERLDHLRDRFFYDDKHTILGQGRMDVTLYDKKTYPEMQLWTYNNVLYVTVHMVGSNNAYYDNVDANCTASLERFDQDCARANHESQTRTTAAIQFVQEAFQIAKDKDMAGILVAMQANMIHQNRILSGSQRFWTALVTETNQFEDKPVVLFHGDGHFFKVQSNPLGAAHNLVQVQCPGHVSIGWILCNVDPTSPHVFQFTHKHITELTFE